MYSAWLTAPLRFWGTFYTARGQWFDGVADQLGPVGASGAYLSIPFEELKEGSTGFLSHTVSERDITNFAQATGDKNPIHLDDGYAKKTIFKGRIAHGLLTGGFISALFGTTFPGPGTVYVSQTLNFKAPVRIGDVVVVRAIVTEIDSEKRRAKFECVCRVGEKIVLEGEAVLQFPRVKKGS